MLCLNVLDALMYTMTIVTTIVHIVMIVKMNITIGYIMVVLDIKRRISYAK